jgi:hypothetical protein
MTRVADMARDAGATRKGLVVRLDNAGDMLLAGPAIRAWATSPPPRPATLSTS